MLTFSLFKKKNERQHDLCTHGKFDNDVVKDVVELIHIIKKYK